MFDTNIRGTDILSNTGTFTTATELATQLAGEFVAPGDLVPLASLAEKVPEHLAVVYMQRRGYTPQMMKTHGLCYCTRAERPYRYAEGRIVFPILFCGKLRGWMARYLGTSEPLGQPPDKDTPKVICQRGFHKSKLLYNFDAARHSKHVVIVEGPTDCHKVGATAVALFGKTVSHSQCGIIAETWRSPFVYLLLDHSAYDDALKAQEKLRKCGVLATPLRLPPGRDPGDYDPAEISAVIHKLAREAGVPIPQNSKASTF